jgi:hypothetical protein
MKQNTLFSLKSHLLAFSAGVLGAAIPNDRSNIHPLLMGALVSLFFVKVLLGDYDIGYTWTVSDIAFALIVGLEGVFGALLFSCA